ncbi:MAG: hypothetical protein QOF83_1561 [Solirubrobacteraceae bacterium]|jgi:hypothetical protein|nr:hypothetical protein [Solirubrobacteraceae bacterium]
MLASITPLGERGRHNRYPLTMAVFVLGSVGAATLGGLALGAIGSLMLSALPTGLRLGALAAAVLLAIGLDLLPGPVPGPRRQVNEQWLDRYRGWVYGVGFGAQLGIGATTIVTSAATYVAMLAAVLSASPGAGALILGVYGAVRGLTPLLAVRSRTTPQLMALHAALARAAAPVARAGVIALVAVLLAAVVGATA